MRQAELPAAALLVGMGACAQPSQPLPGQRGLPAVPTSSAPSEAPADATGLDRFDAGPAQVAHDAGMDAGSSVMAWRINEVPGAPCVPSRAPRFTFLSAGQGLTFDRAGVAADRYFGFDSGSLAFVTFAPGMEAGAPVSADLLAVAGTSSGLLALELDSTGALFASAFDASGARTGASVQLDGSGTANHALGVGASGLGAWNRGGRLRSRWLSASAAGSTLDFGAGSCGELDCQPVVLPAADHFVLIWGRGLHDGSSVISWAALSAGAGLLASTTLLSGRERRRLVGAALLPDEGVALLVAEGAPPRGTLLQLVDPFGQLRGPAYRLLGALEPWAIASAGSTLAVAARSTSGGAILRTLSAEGQPASPWICLDDGSPSADSAARAAPFADGTGYGVVIHQADGSSAYTRLGEDALAAD